MINKLPGPGQFFQMNDDDIYMVLGERATRCLEDNEKLSICVHCIDNVQSHRGRLHPLPAPHELKAIRAVIKGEESDPILATDMKKGQIACYDVVGQVVVLYGIFKAEDSRVAPEDSVAVFFGCDDGEFIVVARPGETKVTRLEVEFEDPTTNP